MSVGIRQFCESANYGSQIACGAMIGVVGTWLHIRLTLESILHKALRSGADRGATSPAASYADTTVTCTLFVALCVGWVFMSLGMYNMYKEYKKQNE